MLKRYKGLSSTVYFQEIKDAVLCGLNFWTLICVCCRSSTHEEKLCSVNQSWNRQKKKPAASSWLYSSDISYYLQPLLSECETEWKEMSVYIKMACTRNRRTKPEVKESGAASTDQSTSVTKRADMQAESDVLGILC